MSLKRTWRHCHLWHYEALTRPCTWGLSKSGPTRATAGLGKHSCGTLYGVVSGIL